LTGEAPAAWLPEGVLSPGNSVLSPNQALKKKKKVEEDWY
jgi:hypothetical protein